MFVPRVPSPTIGVLLSGLMLCREPLDVLGGEDVHEEALQMVTRLFQCILMVTGGHFADALFPGSPQRTLQHHTGPKEYVVVRAGAQSVVDGVLAGRLGDASSVTRFVGEEASTASTTLCAPARTTTFSLGPA